MPTRQITSPDGAKIDLPDAPALSPTSKTDRFAVRGYRITGNTVFDQSTLLKVIADSTGQASLAELSDVADRLSIYYRDHGYLLARAYLPQQEIDDGIVTIAVLEGRYDRLAIDNRARISDERVSRTMTGPLCSHDDCSGALISRRPIERGLLLLNDTPGAQAAARLAPGDITGTSSLGVNAFADPLVSGYVQLDSGGSYYSGVARGIGTLWVNSPTGIGDQITLQGVATAVHGNLYYGTLGYGLPLGYGGTRLGVRGSYLTYELGDRYESLDAHGTVTGGDAMLSHPFVRRLAGNLTGTAGYGLRRFHDQAEAVQVDTSRRISDRMEVGLNGDLHDRLFGVPALNTFSLLYTWGELELDDALSLSDALSARSAGGYGKWMASYSRSQSLFARSSLYMRVAVQRTADNLDSYEKFALGGPDSVRAYPSSETAVDQAVLYSIEWRQSFPAQWTERLEGVLFYDHARGDRNASPWDNSSANRVELSGVGVGLNCELTNRIMLRSTVAFRGDRPMTAAPDSSYHYGLSLNMAF